MIKSCKRILLCVFLFLILSSIISFADGLFVENFENYPTGDISSSLNWRIKKGEDTDVSISQIEGNKVLKMTTTDSSHIQKSSYENLDKGNFVFNIRIKIPSDSNNGSVNVSFRGLEGESSNQFSLCELNGKEIKYSYSSETSAYNGDWVDICAYIEKTGRLRIYENGLLKLEHEDFKKIKPGFNKNNNSFSLRITATSSGGDLCALYDDISIYKNISLNSSYAVSEAVFKQSLSKTDSFEETSETIPYLKSGSIKAEFIINALDSNALNEGFNLYACRYSNGELISFERLPVDGINNGYVRSNIPAKNLSENEEIKLIYLDTEDSIVPKALAKSYKLPSYVRYFPNELEEMYEKSGVHPRIMMTASDFFALKEKYNSGDTTITQWCEKLFEKAEAVIREEPVTYSIKEGGNLLAKSRRVLERITVLGIAYNITGNTEYSDRAWKELKAAGEFPDWNPSHFFSTAEMTAAFAIGYDWMYNTLDGNYSDGVTKRAFIENCILEKGLSEGEALYEKMIYAQAPFSAGGNQNPVANGGMVLGALALADNYPERAFKIISNSLESLPYSLKNFAPDGAWYEGPDYWRYTVQYLTMMTKGLETTFGTDFCIPFFDGIEESMEYIYHMRGPVSFYNYHDSDGACNSPVMFYYADKFNRPDIEKQRLFWLNNNMEEFMPLDLVYYKGISNECVNSLPLGKYFGGEEIIAMRSSWEDSNALYVAAHAGAAESGHSHLDCGSFVLDYNGVRWASDLGRESLSYTNTYSEDKKYELYRLRPEGHNTLVINPDSDPGQELTALTKVEKYDFNSATPFAIMDLTSAYILDAQSVKRGIKLTNNKTTFNIRDEIVMSSDGEIYWFMQTPAQVTLNDNVAVLTKDGKTMYLTFSSNATSAEFSTDLSASPLPSSPNPEGQADNSAYKRIAIKLKGNGSIYLDVCISANSNEEINSVSLSQWN